MKSFFDAKNAKNLRGKEKDWIFVDFAAFFKPFASNIFNLRKPDE